MKATPFWGTIIAGITLLLPACDQHHADKGHGHGPSHQHIVATSPKVQDVIVTQQYVCQIQSQRHIEVCALQDGYLQEILVKEGQAVKQGDVIFRILPTLYQARYAAEKAEAELAQIEFNNTKALYESTPPVVSIQEVNLAQAKLDKANAKAKLAAAEVEFTVVKAPFDGIVDRLQKQLGSLIDKKDCLTTLSDNRNMWVYFNVPEVRYLDYMMSQETRDESQHVELVLANGAAFPQPGKIAAIEAKFNNETGNIPFRADFANPTGLLRHGQTGKVLIHRTVKKALVIPQRATFEILDKRYVFVVGEDRVVKQREITIEHELEDIFVVSNGLKADEKIVVEGVRQIHDGDKIDFETHTAEHVLEHQKKHAE